MKHFIRQTSFSKWLLRLSLITLALATVTGAGNAQTAYPHHAGLVIKFGNGSVYTRCIDLGDDGQASGYDVMQAAGDLTLIADFSYGLGAAMCKINQQGCNFPAESCFCQCQLVNPNDTCQYWSYWHLVGDHWQYSSTGSSAYTVQSGAVEGWAWGTGSTTSAAPPPLLTFDQICAPATATPTATATATPTPSATWTPTVTPSSQPTLSEDTPQPEDIQPGRIATPAPAVGSTVTPRPTVLPSATPQPASATPDVTPTSTEAVSDRSTPDQRQNPLPPIDTLTPAVMEIARADISTAIPTPESAASSPALVNAVSVATAAPPLTRAESTTASPVWIIFGAVAVSLTIGLLLLQRATRSPQ